jgi:hypothetical protein
VFPDRSFLDKIIARHHDPLWLISDFFGLSMYIGDDEKKDHQVDEMILISDPM